MESYETHMAGSMQHLCEAIRKSAIGLRATYILLEKIERQQLKGP